MSARIALSCIICVCALGKAYAAQANTGDDQSLTQLLTYDIYSGVRSTYFSDQKEQAKARPETDSERVYLGLRFNQPLWQNWLLDGDVRGVYLHRNWYNSTPDDVSVHVEVKRLRLLDEALLDSQYWSLEFGRKRLRSARSWLFDDDMDYFQLMYDSTLLDIDFGVAGWLWDGRIGGDSDDREEDQTIESSGSYYLFFQIEYQWFKDNYFRADVFYENYKNPRNQPNNQLSNVSQLLRKSRSTWFKLSFDGQKLWPSQQLFYFMDLARSEGSRRILTIDTEGAINGLADQSISDSYALHSGLQLYFNNKNWGLAVNYAIASADDLTDGHSSAYYQPVIATSKTQMLGGFRRRNYGELLAPKLDNLRITSFHLGFAFRNDLWLELSHYYYNMRHPQPFSLNSRTRHGTSGNASDVGASWEITFAGTVASVWQLSLIVASFRGGDAFDLISDNNDAYRAVFEIRRRW